jgi:hypothetical protein
MRAKFHFDSPFKLDFRRKFREILQAAAVQVAHEPKKQVKVKSQRSTLTSSFSGQSQANTNCLISYIETKHLSIEGNLSKERTAVNK